MADQPVLVIVGGSGSLVAQAVAIGIVAAANLAVAGQGLVIELPGPSTDFYRES